MKILVTGGAGYIGAHTCVELLNQGYEVVIADNLVNSKIETIDKIKEITNKTLSFYEYDVTKEAQLEKIFQENQIDGVIHFAGLKAVGESVSVPLAYYGNNLISTMVLLNICLKYKVNKFVFSSSATVYGDNPSPLSESMTLLKTTNPYGETKVMCERILSDVAFANKDFGVMLLRYFNPVGAHESGLIGENPNGIPNNLMPFITKVAKGELEKLNVFGKDYDTTDGTGVRDYIHVVDLAKGHIKALEKLTPGTHVFNLGTGKGNSVLEIIKAFEKENHLTIPFEIVGRRNGDLGVCYADASKAKVELNWAAEKTIEDMVRDAWRFEKNNLIK